MSTKILSRVIPTLSIQIPTIRDDLLERIFIECDHLNRDGSYVKINIMVYPEIIDYGLCESDEERFNCVLKNSKGFEIEDGSGPTALIARDNSIIEAKKYVDRYHSPSNINIKKIN